MENNKTDLIIALVVSTLITFGMGIHASLRYDLKAGLLYFVVFGVITGVLLVVSFMKERCFMIKDFLEMERKREEGDIFKRIFQFFETAFVLIAFNAIGGNDREEVNYED